MALRSEDLLAVVEDASDRLGGTLKIGTARLAETQAFKKRVADASQAIFVDGISRQHDCVLIVSNPQFPDFAKDAGRRGCDVKSRLGCQLGRPVCTPLLMGCWDGRSYAVYARLDGYSHNKYLRRVQTLSSRGRVFAWLAAVFNATKSASSDPADQGRHFLAPLRTLSEDSSLDTIVRQVASALESRIVRGEMRTFNCLEHGDFWFGNVLFPRSAVGAISPLGKEIKVIDWGGSRLDGYPGIDALRFSVSALGRGRLASEGLLSYCGAAGLSKAEIGISCACALGRLATDLNHFPKDRFNGLASRVITLLCQHDFIDLR